MRNRAWLVQAGPFTILFPRSFRRRWRSPGTKVSLRRSQRRLLSLVNPHRRQRHWPSRASRTCSGTMLLLIFLFLLLSPLRLRPSLPPPLLPLLRRLLRHPRLRRFRSPLLLPLRPLPRPLRFRFPPLPPPQPGLLLLLLLPPLLPSPFQPSPRPHHGFLFRRQGKPRPRLPVRGSVRHRPATFILPGNPEPWLPLRRLCLLQSLLFPNFLCPLSISPQRSASRR